MDQSHQRHIESLSGRKYADAVALRDALEPLRDMVVSSLCLVSEIPGPSGSEDSRMQFVMDRFREAGLDRISRDEAGNAFGILPGAEGDFNLLAVAHADTLFSERLDHTVHINPDQVSGAGVADNSLGLATIVSLPSLLEKLDIQLKPNLVLMASTSSLGRGDLAGMRFFLESRDIPIAAGLCVEGADLGRLSYSSLGMLRAQIDCRIEDDDDLMRTGGGGAVSILSQIVAGLERIPLPGRPTTRIILGSCQAGVGFNKQARACSLRFEVQGEEIGMVSKVRDHIHDVIEEIRLRTGVELLIEEIARRSAGGISFGNPLVAAARRVMRELGVEPVITPSVGDLSALLSAGISAVTLGVSLREGEAYEETETIALKPITTGLAQIVAFLASIEEPPRYE